MGIRRDTTMDTLAVGIGEAGRMTGVSSDTIRRQIKTGALSATRIGKRWVIPVDALRAMLEKNQHAGAA